MLAKPSSISRIGLVQVILAAAFVGWLLFFPSTGDLFAWPVIPAETAMFIGAGFIARVYLGVHLWRQKEWQRLRWQVGANYGFLGVILLATFWHIEAMNWTANIVVAHIWVIAYVVEPLLLVLIEPRGEAAKEPLPAELRRGPILQGLRWLCATGFILGVSMAALMMINPEFMDTRWPWPLDPFDARIMAAFLTLTGLWALQVYLAEDWGEARYSVLGLILFSAAEFAVWAFNVGGFEPSRNNVWSPGIVFGLFAVLSSYYYWRQERAAAPSAGKVSHGAGS